jgi:hypothetical protein
MSHPGLLGGVSLSFLDAVFGAVLAIAVRDAAFDFVIYVATTIPAILSKNINLVWSTHKDIHVTIPVPVARQAPAHALAQGCTTPPSHKEYR